MAPDFISLAPHSTGVYLFRNGGGTVIYVGKANDLKKRMNQYFSGRPVDTKTGQLVLHVQSVEFIITNSETEALILESNLIKKFRGKYNVDLKDSYRYPFVQITHETFPRLVVIRAPKKSVKQRTGVFGPFVDAVARKRTISLLEKNFKLRTCHALPKKACLLFYMNQCTAPCIANVSKEEYSRQVEQARLFLSGNKNVLTEKLEKEMKELAKKRLFELAIQKRDALRSLQSASTSQVVERFVRKDQDIIAFYKGTDRFVVMVLPIRKGTLLGKKQFEFRTNLVGEDLLEDFVLNFYAEEKPPHEIVLPVSVSRAREIEKDLSSLAGHAVKLVTNPKGNNRQLIEMAKKNLEYALNPQNDALLELKNRLLLPKLPERIEGFDISHFGGEHTSAAMVSFLAGKPDKGNYRHFLVKTVEGISDVDAMKEVLQRRYGGSLALDTPLPDLVLVDGGKPQLSASLAALQSVHVKVPVVALAKRLEELFVPYRTDSIRLPKNNAGLRVLMNVRDEAHRFSNRLRKKQSKKK